MRAPAERTDAKDREDPTMADDKRSRRGQGRRFTPARLAVLGLITATLVAVVAALFWPTAPLDPLRPTTWPVSGDRAVVVAAGLQRKCPHNKIWWYVTGKAWLEAGTWQQAAGGETDLAGEDEPITLANAGTLCLRAGRDLGPLQKVGTGAESAPNAALYLAVTPREGDCPAGTSYATPRYCLIATPLPPAPDIAP